MQQQHPPIRARRRGHLTFVVPCWNEEVGLGACLAAVREAGDLAVSSGEIEGWELAIVDDGSTDSTPTILAQSSAEDPRIRVVTHDRNRGLGAAIRSGFDAASGDLVLYTDADMPCDLSQDLPRALRLLRTYDADVVAAYRQSRRGEGPRRLVYSAAYNALVRAVFGLRLRDVNFAFKLFRRSTVDTSLLQSEGSFVDVELLARAHASQLRIVQFGTDYFPRTRGVSTLSSLGTIRGIVAEMRTIGRTLDRAPDWRDARPQPRLLVVNADDYGLTEGVSEGILRAGEAGVVTSTSVLALGSAFTSTAALLRSTKLGVGVHLAAVGEDPPLLSAREVPTLVDQAGRLPPSWRAFVPRFAAGRIDPADLEREFQAQLDAVAAVGVPISHLDTHQHLHLWPGVRDAVIRIAQRASIRAVRVPRSVGRGPRAASVRILSEGLARRARDAGLAFPAWAAGLDEAGHMHGADLEHALAVLERRHGHAELSAHPGIPRDVSRYRWSYEWHQELDALVAPATKARIAKAGFQLGSYHDLVAQVAAR